MPVTVKVAAHNANPIRASGFTDVEGLTKAACYKEWKESGDMLGTSATSDILPTLVSHNNGFVRTVIQAHGNHHHLVIRYDLRQIMSGLTGCNTKTIYLSAGQTMFGSRFCHN